MIKLQEPEPISREEFEKFLRWNFPRETPVDAVYCTYIAKCPGCDVYKIGRSRNLISREQGISGYGGFSFKMKFFINKDIELQLLRALAYAGALRPSERYRSELFFLTHDDVAYLVKRFKFLSISEYKKS